MRYDHKKIEPKWQKIWLKEKIYEPDLKSAENPFYNLMMFPYPSAEGLHVGHAYTFSGADVYGRFKRMQEWDVFQPIGYDSFGIHSENYALKIGEHPQTLIQKTTKRYEEQLKSLGIGYAWDEALSTSDEKYYRWTQWIFVQMFKNGLAYRKKASVNWCPGCKTVLADEQVIAGKCERCDSVATKKELEQWFFKITDYAEKLLNNLGEIDWSEKIKVAQRNWIGRSEGAVIRFPLSKSDFNSNIEVFTTRPDTLFGATYMVLAPEHPLIKNFQFSISNFQEAQNYIERAQKKSEADRIAEGKEKTGVELKEIKAINPANGEEIPIWVADYVLGNVGTGAIMAVPAHDQRDFEFATKFNLPIKMVVCSHYPAKTCPVMDKAYTGEGHLVGSGKFDGMDSRKARGEITKFVNGATKIQYRLRDWLISRQRYWGPPIPMIHCDTCGWQSVPEKDLPIKLPNIKDFRPTGTDKSPLATVEKFYKARCPKCNSWARRETDVSDTFLDSAWYYLGYLGTQNAKRKTQNHNPKLKTLPWDEDIVRKWCPVDMYIGGAEHAVLHLLYVRFLAMAFKDWGLVNFDEPFKKFRAHGLIIKDGTKMSKSRGNVVNPDDYIKAYGADALRMYLLFLGPFEQGGDFRDTGIRGITRFLERVWKISSKIQETSNKQIPNYKSQIQNVLHKTIKKITEDIENLQYNTAVSALMIMLNEFESGQIINKKDFEVFIKLLAPFAPHITEEIWRGVLKNKKSIHIEKWPEFDLGLLEEKNFELIVQVNGKFRGRVSAVKGISEEEAKAKAASLESVKTHLAGSPKKVIFVPDKLINFVL